MSASLGHGLVLSEASPEPLQRLQLRFAKYLGRELFGLPLTLLPAPQQKAAIELRRRFEALTRTARRQAFALLLRPQLHVHLLCAALAAREQRLEEAVRQQQYVWPQLAFEMRLDGHLEPEGWTWPEPGHAGPASPRHRMPETAYAAIGRAMVLALVDHNPLSMNEAHPDKQGNALDLGEASSEDWVAALRGGLDLIETHLPGLRYEMDRVIHQFVPVGTDDRVHLSASYAESVGTIYLSLHPSLMTMTEAIIHEYQHNKLNMLFSLDPVMHNAYHPLYSSPVRPDPRPLAGVLLAAHAFVPVAELYRRLDDPRLQTRFATIVEKNREALETLTEHAQATPAGQAVIDELCQLHTTHAAAVAARATGGAA